MTTDQHIQFLRRMIAEMQSQIADLEAQQKAEFDAKQMPLIEDGHQNDDGGWVACNGLGRPNSLHVNTRIRCDYGEKCFYIGPAGCVNWFRAIRYKVIV